MGELVRITDVSPRDGLQNEPGVIPAAQKARLVELLCASGVEEVEVTSFVSPKWVPQLGDAEEVLGMVRGAGGRRRHADAAGVPLPGPLPKGEGGRPFPVLSVLVPNEKGFERALEIHRSGLPLKVSFFTAASETFSKRNTNATIAETIERFRPLVPRALDEGMWVRVYISCAVACPFEGAIAPEAVRRVADMAVALGGEESDLVEIDLGDTIGVAHPHEIEAVIGALSEEQRDRLTLHLHDTFGRAAACVRAGLAMGVRSFDGSVAGLGGCPYASTPGKRAPGNISTELLVRTVREAGYATMVDDAALAEAAAYAREIVDASRASAGGAA